MAIRLYAWCSVGLLALSSPSAATPLFVAFGDHRTTARAISGDGSTVVGENLIDDPDPEPPVLVAEAFRWTQAEGSVGLGDLPGGALSSIALGVSGDGSTIVGSGHNAAENQEGFVWTPGGGMVGLGGPFGASAVSADGSILVGSGLFGGGQFTAFRWTSGGGFVDLGILLGGHNSFALDVSADGSMVVGDASSALGSQAFLWTTASGIVGLGDLPGGSFESAARAISGDGSTVVGQSSSSFAPSREAFLWTSGGGMVGLGVLLPGGPRTSDALAVSADGSIVVGHSWSDDRFREAFIWDATNGMRELDEVLVGLGLDLTGWTLIEATGISDDGRVITGNGIGPNGQQSWVAVLPEPGASLLIGLALAVGCAVGRRRDLV